MTVRDSHFYHFRYSSRHCDNRIFSSGIFILTLRNDQVNSSLVVDFAILNHSIYSLGSSNRLSRTIKSIISFWPSTDDQFDYLEGCPIVDHHIWSARPSRYWGWPSIFLRVPICVMLKTRLKSIVWHQLFFINCIHF